MLVLSTRVDIDRFGFTGAFRCDMDTGRVMTQGVLTVVTEITPGRADQLVALLDELDTALTGEGAEPIVDFRSLDTVHFARFVVLPGNSEGRRHLVFSTAYDGPLRFHLAELALRASAGLCAIYAHCVSFPDGAAAAPATLLAYLSKSSVPYGAMHVGYVGRRVADIRDEERLRRFVQTRLDAAPPEWCRSGSARDVRARIMEWVQASDFRWALAPRAERISRSGVEQWWTHIVAVFAAGLALLSGGVATFVMGGVIGLGVYVAVLVGSLGLLVWRLRSHEELEPAKTDSDVEQGLEHAGDEDFGLRNQLSHIVDVKPTFFRRALLRAVLFAVEFRARFEFFKGDLGGIETIHCAHWAVIAEGAPRLLFFSNYDGSWERYLGDFIEEAGGGMTSVWSNTVLFPRARFLLWGGATEERAFKAWTRERQIVTQVWYAANPGISIRNVNDNSRLRDGLTGYMTEEEARAWLKLL